MSEGNAGFAERLHYLLMRQVIETGHAPDLTRLADLAERSVAETEEGLRRLAGIHGVILEPNSTNVWSLHPFAMQPTAFWVSAGGRGWWANCAWCSLAIGAAIREDVNVTSRDGAEGSPLEFRVERGRATRPEIVMHFPYSAAKWWDNPYCPCGNILFFSAAAKIDEWCARHGRPKGAVLNMDTAIALAEKWFGDYAAPNWNRKTPEQASAIFAELGLDPRFWSMPASFR